MGMMRHMRRLIEADYLPKLRTRSGFMSAFLLEQVDDQDRAELITIWENQAAAEEFTRTGLAEAFPQALAAALPGARVQRQGYLVNVHVTTPSEDTAPMPAQVG
jgi:heme-degrading monooxygenase HmoA